ncbi:hypothetical protein DL93DRAFT_135836 [Clavulina sp. PMI_390]|nr:hypothetical protein DL93DRAFT_135836 [Clavulina sp. PMI_390]
MDFVIDFFAQSIKGIWPQTTSATAKGPGVGGRDLFSTLPTEIFLLIIDAMDIKPFSKPRDLFSTLPTEIFLLIIDAMDIKPFSKPNPLHTLSCVNRRLNRFTHMYIWRDCFIGPRAGVVVEPRSSRKHIHERMKALLRNSQRAAYVHQLTLEPTFADALLISKVPSIFLIVPNLRKLNIHISQTSSEALAVSDGLARAMEKITYPLPFQLDELECEASLFTSPPGIYKFLLAQPSIRRLSIRRTSEDAPFWTAPKLASLRAEHGLFDETSPALLPSIQELHGPSSYATLLLHGVQHSLKSIVLYTQSTTIDLTQCHTRHNPTHREEGPERSIGFRLSPCCTEASHPSASLLARSHSLCLWTDGRDIWAPELAPGIVERVEASPTLPFLLLWGYNISPSSLRFLRIGCLKHFPRVESQMTNFPLVILRELSGLEELEWLLFDEGYLRDESTGVLGLPSVRNAAQEFLEGVRRESASDNISKISFIAFKKRCLELVRLKTESDTLNALWKQEDNRAVTLCLAGGSKWTMSINMERIAEVEFFQLRPINCRKVARI